VFGYTSVAAEEAILSRMRLIQWGIGMFGLGLLVGFLSMLAGAGPCNATLLGVVGLFIAGLLIVSGIVMSLIAAGSILFRRYSRPSGEGVQRWRK